MNGWRHQYNTSTKPIIPLIFAMVFMGDENVSSLLKDGVMWGKPLQFLTSTSILFYIIGKI